MLQELYAQYGELMISLEILNNKMMAIKAKIAEELKKETKCVSS